MSLATLKNNGEAPNWMNEESYKTLQGGYLLKEETPRQMYERVAKAAASYYPDSIKWESKFYEAMWKNWLCPASPVLSNMGTDRGLPISCNSIHVGDSVDSIFNKNHELAMLSKNGAGVGIYLGDVRGRGASIKGNGHSEGVIPWAKVYDSTIVSVSQANVRRGAAAVYIDIRHVDIEEFIQMRRPTGDVNRRCMNLNHGICIDDLWMQEMIGGDQEKRSLWSEILRARVESGEPYLFFTDNVNKANPESYKSLGLKVSTSNICCVSADTEVMTKIGPVKIANLVGKETEVWDGINWITNSSFSQRGEDKLIRITIKDGSQVDSNPNHRWFVAHDYEDIRKNKYELTLTKDLKVGDFVECHYVESHGDKKISGAYLKGFLVGDGTQADGRPLLRLHSTKYECSDYLISSCLEIPVEQTNTNAITDPSFSKEMNYTDKGKAYGNQILKNMRGLSVRKKDLINWASDFKYRLPEDIFSWNRESKLKFLSGLFDSDGTVMQRSCLLQLSSSHFSFLKDLRSLLKTFGISGSIDKCQNAYRISIGSFDAYRLITELSCHRIKYLGPIPNRKTTGWRKIENIVELEGVHPVYCPTLPTTGKFALANGLMTGNTEIMLYTDPEHSFVCCLSSLNLVKWEEWKDSDVIETSVRFLDAVLEEYIKKSEKVPGLEASRRSAVKGRAIGIGVLGWHTLLQKNMIPFDSFDAMMMNSQIFKTIKTKAEAESAVLAKELGEPLWCKGHGRRNTHLIAVAPTVSNSTISGGHSAGIEPLAANIFSKKSAKGTFIVKNIVLEDHLESIGKNTVEVWKSINEQSGSVQHLKFLSENQKAVFLTAREINQYAIIKQAAQRQKFIDQGQSVNLFFGANSDPKYINQVHIEAWQSGLKSLYYFRTEGVIKGDLASRSKEECAACEG